MNTQQQTIKERSVALHKEYQGKLETTAKVHATNRDMLSLLYTPGVAEPCLEIAKDKSLSYDLTLRGRTIAVISDGTAVLGLGDIGPEAGMPVMEGKALLMKEFGGVDAFPLVIDTKDPAKIIEFVKTVAPSFAGINLEDISAPRCFQIEEALQDIGIPVFHDDQHGTAIVVRAALLNAAKVVGKPYASLRVALVGAGAAGMAIARMLLAVTCTDDHCELAHHIEGVADLIVYDTKGAIVVGRDGQNIYKQAIAGVSNREKRSGSLEETIDGFDVVIGVSGPGTITAEAIKKMSDKPIVCALANPTPEIMPEEAKKAGAYIVASGRSDFPNQINNVLAFPGIFQAVVRGRLKSITLDMKVAASNKLASLITKPTTENIIPDIFTENLATMVADAVLEVR
jgi:malate dehydrogenase (oxaloacetate-decarboxylating)